MTTTTTDRPTATPDPGNGLGIVRRFTTLGVHPYDTLEWECRDARIMNWRDGTVSFEQIGIEVPVKMSVNASNILASKYFRGNMGSPDREYSLRQVADRVADTITAWGIKDGYFEGEEEAETFRAELKYIIVHQMAAFNSPVWFNIGVAGVPQQAAACFILEVPDNMEGILNWYREEGLIFKGGSGSGANLSRIRSSKERMNGGGHPSGPVSFMRGADSSAGTIKSGGKTRRAAKMVILDADHPDIEDFVECKVHEERKARVLRDAGFDMDLDGADAISLQYQNANNSVSVTDAFMQAVIDDGPWDLIAVTTGEVIETIRARDLMTKIIRASYDCADPGLQFRTTINRWNTTPVTGEIEGSNPCSEHFRLNNSACNLASINLLTFLGENGIFDTMAYRHAVSIMFVAQDILVGNSDYPTEGITKMARASRDVGQGFANLGASLMALGLPYDSDEGRAWAATVSALQTGQCALVSSSISRLLAPSDLFEANREPWLGVIKMHRDEVANIDHKLVPDEMIAAAHEVWDGAVEQAAAYGMRNAELTVLAPTGTIGLLMDCDTTGVEPDLGLVKTKKLVGGGTMQIVNQTIPRALRRLGYSQAQIEEIIAYIDTKKSIVGAPHLQPDHLAVFACSMGDNSIKHMGHVLMMAAIQPFYSGAISKTVNTPEDITFEDYWDLHIRAWELGLKSIAAYRDNCKAAQPLSMTKAAVKEDLANLEELELGSKAKSIIAKLEADLVVALAAQRVVEVKQPVRERLPRKRRSMTFSFRVADCEGYVTVGQYDDGRPGEVFIKVSKQGSTLAGVMDAFSISLSLGLQHGVPLATYVKKFVNMKFEPAGTTDDPELRLASSILDYMFRRLAVDYLPFEARAELGILTILERNQPTLPGVEEATSANLPVTALFEGVEELGRRMDALVPRTLVREPQLDAPMCFQCGTTMQRAGSCYVCAGCGTTSGCS